jgi:hypothetical protein
MIKKVVTVAVLSLTLVGTAAVAASAAVSVGGCDRTTVHLPQPGNGMTYSERHWQSWMTPPLRTGTCNSIYAENLGVYRYDGGVSRCQHGRVVTYNNDGTQRAISPFVTFYTLLEIHNLRSPVDENRLFRYFGRACGLNDRQPDRPVGVVVYAR